MPYHIYLGGVEFPVVPSSITTKIGNKNKSYELINLDDINRVHPAGLREFKFDLIIPQSRYPFAQYPDGFKPAIDYLVHLNKLKSELLVFRMTISRFTPDGKMIFDTNWDVSIEGYEVKEEFKNGLDHVASLTLKEYKPYYTKKLTINAPTAGESPAGNNAATGVIEEKREDKLSGASGVQPSGSGDGASSVHKVVRNDCLYNIAKLYWGNGELWKEIYKANQSLIDSANAGKNLVYYTIYPGQELVIPART